MYKHKELLKEMTLLEKTALLSGKTVWQTQDISRLSIPSVFCSDGPHGIRKQAGAGDHLGLNEALPATCFPPAGTIANSWDEELGEKIGKAIGEEAVALGVDIVLGPGLNIKRNPLCGRNFEYFSEDPYLSGKMAAAYIRGINSCGVYACPKHFAVNSQELRRMAMNAVVDERTLREIYLTGFEIAVKEGKARAIMSSYNEVNGIYANENRHLLWDILREEWGFDGIVITDWGGSNDHVEGVKAGSNLEMPAPGYGSARQIRKALKEGRITEEEIDRCVDSLLDVILSLAEKKKTKKDNREFNLEDHHTLAREAARASMVLLKNEPEDEKTNKGLLPLASDRKVALIGDFATVPRYQGAGSSAVHPTKLESMGDLMEHCGLNIIGNCRGYQRKGGHDESLFGEALTLAKNSDVVLYCMGLDEISESEGLDRIHMRVRDTQIELLQEIAKVNPNVVAVISAGSAIEMPWEGCCKAILHTCLSGQAGAGAVFDILTGRANPCGKLAETYPLCYEDTPSYHYYPSRERNSEYRESIYVGYRYYDTVKSPVRYPFGYGLSYTKFEYSALKVTEKGVSFRIKNTGEKEGAEIAQLYVTKQDGQVFNSVKELKGFRKVNLKSGEEAEVAIGFDDKTFRFWNVKANGWEVEGGSWNIMIGSNSRDIRLSGSISVEGNLSILPYKKEELPDYYRGSIGNVDDKQYELLLGDPIPDGGWSGELNRNDALCQMKYARGILGRMTYRILNRMKTAGDKKGTPDLNILFQYNMPFRALAKMTGGWISDTMVDGLVRIANGHSFSGFRMVIGGFVTNLAGNFIDKWNLKHSRKGK